MAPEVFFTVILNMGSPPQAIKDMYTFSPAVLKDHIRHRVIGEDYPGVVPEPGHSVLGIYATGLTDANMAKLDFFEGPEYERREVTVSVLDQSGIETEQATTSVYIFKQPVALEKREWDLEEFRREKLSMWTRNDFVFADCTVPASVQKKD
ncbi:hypothetical protein TD95_002189 [Thielaviopsis punctulata]|uniref:Putative gamma-glutamylcyclotransferase n=1 Tax=Thielaviopsis punctulata TaxID=72032 RepID=A0A0F4ZET8_9PEZI|nr:hypothetical protein TD95_002189 [Thielaviopsis punctulata]